MDSNEIRQRFLKFFEQRGHAIIPSASLVPENDPSVLFNTAGMQPLVPYLLGEAHPKGKKLADIQKCVRTNDIDEVGDNTHLTFFEMMGNWSLGDYWKKESINWSFELLTNTEYGFGLDPKRLYVTCFEGDENAPKDVESAEIWGEIFKSAGLDPEKRIFFRPKEKNWWSAGPNGPCGPDTEMFYDLTGELNQGLTLEGYLKADDEQKVVEIWNNVFMQYLSKDGKVVGELPNKNVDTGAGFERMVAVVQGKNSVFETDLFEPILFEINKSLPNADEKSKRLIIDHIRTSIFLIADGVKPSNKDRGYVLRRLIRRAVATAFIEDKKFDSEKFKSLVNTIIKVYESTYSNLKNGSLIEILNTEILKFRKTVEEGLKNFPDGKEGIMSSRRLIFRNNGILDANIAFIMFTTYGFPLELSIEEAKKRSTPISTNITEEFEKLMSKHQELSRQGSEQKFKGGLSGTGEMETKYHTATHLLHQALREVLGSEVSQKGSNITPERLRFDFTFPRKLTDEEKQKVENLVNEKISLSHPVNKVVMKKEDAEKTGALHFFGEKYPDEVNVYYIGDSLDTAFSKEFCGGPHVENIGILGKFKIQKEESVSAGVRRIKAVLE